MGYLVLCTFDLKGASALDYQNAYKDLDSIGLKKVHKSSQGGNVVIPTTAVMGEFNGSNPTQVCNAVRDSVQNAFKARRFKSELFFATGGDSAWAAATI